MIGHKTNKKGLTIKEAGYIKDLIATGNGTEAAARNYNVKSRAVAALISKIVKKKPRIQRAIQEALQRQGLTTDQLAGNLAFLANHKPEKINADTVLHANVESLKLLGAYDKVNRTESFKQIIHKLSNKEIILELEKRTKQSTSLLTETNSLS